ncbi:hypothetical protein J6590_003086 [Homalodisca vitripennis]|nr:hypothetical protein J6590_003086 [Homalodisca vitripennis]
MGTRSAAYPIRLLLLSKEINTQLQDKNSEDKRHHHLSMLSTGLSYCNSDKLPARPAQRSTDIFQLYSRY